MLKIAHRGARLQATENSITAFNRAIIAGADMIELDVQLSKDGHLIVIHDPTLERTTNGQGYIKDLTLAQIKEFKTKDGESVPTLDEVFELCKGKIKLLVEIKAVGCAQKIAELIKKYNNSDEVVIQSFLQGELLEYRQFDNKTKTAILFDELLIDGQNLSLYLQKMQAQGVNMNYKHITSQVLDCLHKNSQFAYAWGLQEKEIPAFAKMDLDGVTLAF